MNNSTATAAFILGFFTLVAGLLGLGALATVLYYWYIGVGTAIATIFGLQLPVAVALAILVQLCLKRFGTILLAILGLWAAINILHWGWVLSILLYFATFGLLFIGSLLALVGLLVGLVVSTLKGK